ADPARHHLGAFLPLVTHLDLHAAGAATGTGSGRGPRTIMTAGSATGVPSLAVALAPNPAVFFAGRTWPGSPCPPPSTSPRSPPPPAGERPHRAPVV
ncbi:hypothetical protein ACWGVN_07720, partial [Streptomyces sp. NPDC055607]